MSTLIKTISPQPVRLIMDDFWSDDETNDELLAGIAIQPEAKLRETKTNYVIEFAVPDYKKEDFKITTENGYLTVQAGKTCDGVKSGTCTCKQSSAFSQTFCLPDNVMEDNIRASYKNGILSIDLQKTATSFSVKKQVKID